MWTWNMSSIDIWLHAQEVKLFWLRASLYIIMFSLIIIQIYSKQICRLPRVEEWDASQRRATILLWWLWSLIKRYFAQRHIVSIQQSSLSFHTDCASTRIFFQFSRLLISKGIKWFNGAALPHFPNVETAFYSCFFYDLRPCPPH